MWKFTYTLYRTSILSPARWRKANRSQQLSRCKTWHVYRWVPMVYSSHATPEFQTFSWMKPRGFSDFAPDQARKLLRAAKSFIGQDSHLVWKNEVQALVLIQGEEEAEVCSLTLQVTELNTERSLLNFTWNSSLETGYSSNESFHTANHFCLTNHHFLSM